MSRDAQVLRVCGMTRGKPGRPPGSTRRPLLDELRKLPQGDPAAAYAAVMDNPELPITVRDMAARSLAGAQVASTTKGRPGRRLGSSRKPLLNELRKLPQEDLAEAYAAVMEDPELPPEVRDQAARSLTGVIYGRWRRGAIG